MCVCREQVDSFPHSILTHEKFSNLSNLVDLAYIRQVRYPTRTQFNYYLYVSEQNNKSVCYCLVTESSGANVSLYTVGVCTVGGQDQSVLQVMDWVVT